MRANFAMILILVFYIATGIAQEQKWGPSSITFNIGSVIPFETFKPSYSILVGTEFGRISNMVELGADITYWKTKYDYYKRKDNPNDDIKRRLIGGYISALIHPMETTEIIDPYMGGGLAINVYTKDYPDGWPEKDKRITSLEPHLDLGIRYKIAEKIIGEFRSRITLSEIDNILLLIGARFDLGI